MPGGVAGVRSVRIAPYADCLKVKALYRPEGFRVTSIRRLYVLLCGYEVIPKTISTRDIGGRFILSEPICAYLLDTETGWVLLDAGVNPDNIRDPERAPHPCSISAWSGREGCRSDRWLSSCPPAANRRIRRS